MVNRADVHCRPPPPISNDRCQYPGACTWIHAKSHAFRFVSTLHPRNRPACFFRYLPRILFPIFQMERAFAGRISFFFYKHTLNTLSRGIKSREIGRKNKMIAILNVHANGNSFYISRKKTVTRSSVICQL